MTTNEMKILIETYIKKHVGGPEEKKYYRKLLLDGKACFMAKWDEWGCDIATAARETVRSAQGGKTEALARIHRFCDFLKGKRINAEISWPPIDDIGKRSERIVFIMREMQTASDLLVGNGMTAVAYLSDLLWVQERTIEDDFSFMMSPEDIQSPRNLFKQSLVINGMKRSKGTVQFSSTAHPLFLIENLTSVLVMIEALLEKAKQLSYRGQAMITARRVWKQLTPYAQGRITELLTETYPVESDEMVLFGKMKDIIDRETNAFEEEKKTGMNPDNMLLYAMKIEQPCTITYKKNELDLLEWTGTIRPGALKESELVLLNDGLTIPIEDIIEVSVSEN